MSLEHAKTYFREGDLDSAIAAAGEAVRAAPGSSVPRLLLAELLLFDGDFARAETLLSALDLMVPDLGLVVAEFRQLVRAALSRHRTFFEGAVPSFIDQPTAAQQTALRGLMHLRAGDSSAAAQAASELEAARPRVPGRWNAEERSATFDDLRDADDLLAGSFEVLTTTGVYYWIPTERLELLEFHAPKRPRDMVWRRCTASVRGGPDGDVYVPVLYPRDQMQPDAIRLGRHTEWTESAPVRGFGQRLLLAGDEGLPLLSIKKISFL